MKKYIHLDLKIILLILLAIVLSPIAVKSAEAAFTSGNTIPSLSIPSGDHPAYIYVPSISLLSSVEGVGIDQKGRMDVPSGKTSNVGWYHYGVIPGESGTAVLDAHNTAAFKNLNKVPVGENIYIFTKQGRVLRFNVSQAKVYSMKNIKSSDLFTPTNKEQVNLITCAGKNLGGGEATHRLIVTAKLVSDSVTTSSTVVSA